jgi:hypothetical protein
VFLHQTTAPPYPIGIFQIDIAELQTAEGKLYLFVAIDRTSKFASVQLVEKANRITASAKRQPRHWCRRQYSRGAQL